MVESSRRQENGLFPGNTPLNPTTMSSTQGLPNDSAENHKYLKYALRSAPITYLFSGIAFMDKKVFESYAVEKSQSVSWVAVLRLLKSQWKPHFGIRDLFKYAIMKNIIYIPPKTDNTTAPVPCSSYALNCNKTEKMCKSSLKYIVWDSDKTWSNYRNFYCQMCRTKETIKAGHSYPPILLKGAMVVLQIGNLLLIKMTDTRHYMCDVIEISSQGDALMLQKIIYTNDPVKKTDLNCTSTIFRCPGDLVLTPMNTCKYRRRLFVALALVAVENSRYVDDSDLFLLLLSNICW